MKAHAIITASDANCGAFLGQHWLPSLQTNVDLEQIDVVVLDFGLSAAQRGALSSVHVVRAEGISSVNVSRRMAVARFLEGHSYDQALVVDAGDLIFQRDISHLFTPGAQTVRGVPERYPIPLPLLLRGTAGPLRKSIRRALRGRPMINGGFLLGPSKQLCELGAAVDEHASELQHDQPFVSSLLHQWGFEALDWSYNFVPWTARRGFGVEDGVFITEGGEVPHVVHNTGLKAPFRIVADFGYGPGYNQRIRKPYLGLSRSYARVRGLAGPAAER